MQEALWRIAVFLLPWQTRYFVEGPMIQGLPWEQGRLSFYLSWMPMVATVGWVLVSSLRAKTVFFAKEDLKKNIWLLAGICLFLFSFFFSTRLSIAFQWLVEGSLLLAFAWALVRLKIEWRTLAPWFVLSLVPHALLGFWQYLNQSVHGSTWLGMASQDPVTKGVSVIESGGRRILRAYGGFPHPNIFGGWLAAGTLILFPLFIQAKKRWQGTAWLILLVLFSVVLLLTFSRGAWLATACGLVLFACFSFFRTPEHRRRLLLFSGTVLVSVSMTGYIVRDAIAPRVSLHGRLEAKSLDERAQGWDNGWRFFWEHPLVGTGIRNYNKVHDTLVPPHHAWLLALNEIGSIGMIGLLILLGHMLGKRGRQNRFFSPIFLSSFLLFLILSFFDYYLWSFWSGMALLCMGWTVLFLNEKQDGYGGKAPLT
jgi:hypothetical protein